MGVPSPLLGCCEMPPGVVYDMWCVTLIFLGVMKKDLLVVNPPSQQDGSTGHRHPKEGLEAKKETTIYHMIREKTMGTLTTMEHIAAHKLGDTPAHTYSY